MQKVTPFLWFDDNAEEAMNFYTSVFKNSKVVSVNRLPEGTPGPAGKVITGTFVIENQEFMALNGGPAFKFTEAISFFVNCEDQTEVNYLWDALTADGGQESQCGWLKDKFGLSWQVIPKALGELMGDSNPKKSQAVMQAMLKMNRIEVDKLQEAYDKA